MKKNHDYCLFIHNILERLTIVFAIICMYLANTCDASDKPDSQ